MNRLLIIMTAFANMTTFQSCNRFCKLRQAAIVTASQSSEINLEFTLLDVELILLIVVVNLIVMFSQLRLFKYNLVKYMYPHN